MTVTAGSAETADQVVAPGRFDALIPAPRQSGPRLPVEVIEMAVALKR